MKKIITILFLALLVLGGFWYFESQKITENNFQPADNDYEFVINSEVEEIKEETSLGEDNQSSDIVLQEVKPETFQNQAVIETPKAKEEGIVEEVKSEISIDYPIEGQIFKPGDTIKIKFSVPDDTEKLLLFANLKGNGYDEDTLLYLKEEGDIREFEYKIPEEAYTNVDIMITALGRKIPLNETLEVIVTPNTIVESISLYNDGLYISKDFVADVILEATRSDGLRFSIYDDPNITYTISDPTIAEYYDTNRIKGIKEGQTELTITYKNLSLTVPVSVFVSNIDSGEIPPRN
jgi:hypothetical protein